MPQTDDPIRTAQELAEKLQNPEIPMEEVVLWSTDEICPDTGPASERDRGKDLWAVCQGQLLRDAAENGTGGQTERYAEYVERISRRAVERYAMAALAENATVSGYHEQVRAAGAENVGDLDLSPPTCGPPIVEVPEPEPAPEPEVEPKRKAKPKAEGKKARAKKASAQGG